MERTAGMSDSRAHAAAALFASGRRTNYTCEVEGYLSGRGTSGIMLGPDPGVGPFASIILR